MIYKVMYTEEAAHVRDALPPERLALLEKGLALLAEDPYREPSAPMSGDDFRVVNIAEGLVVDYVVYRAWVMLICVNVLDRALLVEDDTHGQ